MRNQKKVIIFFLIFLQIPAEIITKATLKENSVLKGVVVAF
jgi:hypothetical protein